MPCNNFTNQVLLNHLKNNNIKVVELFSCDYGGKRGYVDYFFKFQHKEYFIYLSSCSWSEDCLDINVVVSKVLEFFELINNTTLGRRESFEIACGLVRDKISFLNHGLSQSIFGDILFLLTEQYSSRETLQSFLDKVDYIDLSSIIDEKAQE